MAGMALRPPAIGARVLRAACIVLGLCGILLFVTLPLDGPGQAVLTGLGIVFYLVVNRFRSRRASLVLVVLSVTVTARYIFWRAADTLSFDHFLSATMGLGLLAAELYAALLLALAYLQTSYPLDRKPVPLPADPQSWPTIDVYVPSYNESLDLVRPTVFAAMAMDWPPDKMNVWILDDGRRPAFREFAEQVGCGYIIRPDNKGAKAGNINHALRYTSGEYIAIFDCDHAPTRAFLQLTLGWMLRDSRIALVQTPHHFYSADPFERNLSRKRHVPNEGLLFYGLIQQGNDLWNASFFCGSCAVLRRAALLEVGGVPHETVTEDCHCSFRMQQKGWHTAYLRLPLAAGLATERLGLHIGQRMRWARGMLQIFRQENTLFAPGLKLIQRLCYFTSSFSFMFALPRLVFLTAPTAFLFFGQNIIAASPLAITAYAGAHMFHTFATTSRLNGRNRHSFWGEIYEATLAVPLVPVTLLTLWNPRKGKFNVTDKGGTLDNGYLDLRVVWPMMTLLAIMLLAFGIGLYGTLTTTGLTFQAYLLNTIWAGLCLVPTSAAVAVGREREQSRLRARVEAKIPAELVLSNGARFEAVSVDISLSGARLHIGRPLGVADGDEITVNFSSCDEVIVTHATLLHWEDDQAFISFHTDTLADEAAVTRLFFSRPDAWLYWDHWPDDRPLRSLANVVMATAGAVFSPYRFKLSKAPSRESQPAVAAAIRVSDVVTPRGAAVMPAPPTMPAAAKPVRILAGVLAGLLLFAAPARAQGIAPTVMPPTAAVPPVAAAPVAMAPAAAADLTTLPPAPQAATPAATVAVVTPPAGLPPLRPGARDVLRTLRDLGLSGPMQMHGTSDLQGVLFGLRDDEVVTAAELTVIGASSPALIPSLSQIAITLNEQPVGTLQPDPARGSFGPAKFAIDPLFFTEINRLNFRFTGRYAPDCNDPMSGLLWANVSDLSTLALHIERLPPQRDLARLPGPLFDHHVLRAALVLPVVLPEATGPTGLRAAAIAASYFATEADYRGATFPVRRGLPPQGNALVIAAGTALPEGLAMPPADGPMLALLPNPSDPFGTLLVLAGRNEADVAAAALTLAAARTGLAGVEMRVQAPLITARAPYDAPHWLPRDRPAQFGALVDTANLQASGFAAGSVRIPMRTAPDLYNWRNYGVKLRIGYRAPPGPVIDVAASRLDVSLSGSYLGSFTLADAIWGPVAWAMDRLGIERGQLRTGSLSLPTYLLLGHDELQLRFDMRPLGRGECAAIPGDIQAAIDPGSTVDISGAWHYARLPNLGYFGSAGFPFTRLADLSGTAVVMPDRPSLEESEALLDLVGQLAAGVGTPSTGLQVVGPGTLGAASDRDLLIIGSLGTQSALATLLKTGPLHLADNRLTLDLPDALQDARSVFLDVPDGTGRTRASAALAAAGDGFGIILGRESPWRSGRSVVAISGSTPLAVLQAVAALRDPVVAPEIRGDLSLLQEGQVTSFSTVALYGVGDLPWWLLPQIWIGGRPERVALIGFGAALLIGFPLFWMVRRRAATRLRARTPKS